MAVLGPAAPVQKLVGAVVSGGVTLLRYHLPSTAFILFLYDFTRK